MNGVEGYTYSQLKPLVEAVLEQGLSVMIYGHPGVGKSTMAREIAAKFGLPVIEKRLSQIDPSDLGGVFFPDKEQKTTVRMMPEWLKEAGDKPFFLFLDEVNAGVTKQHKASCMQIILDHQIDMWKFPKGTMVLAAGNYVEDSDIVTPLTSPERTRFAQFHLKADPETWINYGIRNGIPPDVLAFIKFRPELLYKDTGEDAFPTPRTWEFASNLYSTATDKENSTGKELTWKRLMSSVIGAPTASEFHTYLKVYRSVNIEEILSGKYPELNRERPDLLCAVVFALAYHVIKHTLKPEQSKNLAGIFNQPGFGREYQILFFKKLVDNKADIYDKLAADPNLKPLVRSLQKYLD